MQDEFETDGENATVAELKMLTDIVDSLDSESAPMHFLLACIYRPS